jgi:hypothetical protein
MSNVPPRSRNCRACPRCGGSGSKELPDEEIAWLRAFGNRMIERGVEADFVARYMSSMDRPNLSEDPEAAADGEMDAWSAE